MDLALLTRSADQIIVGDVLSVTAVWDRDHRNIYSTVEIGVRETWKGAAPATGKIVIRHLGGSVGEIEMAVLGEVSFAAGERSVLFLRDAHTVGMAQGKRRLRWEGSSKRWLVAAPDHRGARVLPEPQAAPADEALGAEESLDALRAKVRALLQK